MTKEMKLIPLLDASAQFLEDLASGKTRALMYSMGLCTNLSIGLSDQFGDRERRYMMDLMKLYFIKAGMHEDYPIEGSLKAYNDQSDKYDRNTEFGRKRIELAIELAAYFRSEISTIF
jgi:hypothetical protein